MRDPQSTGWNVDEIETGTARARTWGFYSAVTVAVLFLAVPMAPFLVVPIAWPFLSEQLGIHQLHDIGVATLLWLMLVGLLLQYREPRRQIAAMQQTLTVVLVLVASTAITRPGTLLSPLLLPFALSFVAAALHPARREVGKVRGHLDLRIVVLGALAAGPALAYAAGQLRLDSSLLPIMAHGGHWTSMGSLAATIVALALLSATKPRGWPVTLWSAGAAAFLFGVASFFLPHQASSVGRVWALLVVAWAIALLVAGSGLRPTRMNSQSMVS